ncbi:MAG: hypothetical protein WCJ29_02605 [bacterium]
MRIHFVCRGNTFRSRLAEGFMRKNYPGIEVSSSGVAAENNLDGHITWYAQCIAVNEGFAGSLKPTWTQTTPEVLMQADLIITLDESIRLEVENRFVLPKAIRLEQWDIADIQEPTHSYEAVFETTEQALRSFRDLKVRLQSLVKNII